MDVKYGVAQAAFFCPNQSELEKVESESSQTFFYIQTQPEPGIVSESVSLCHPILQLLPWLQLAWLP